jgi:hypothetical protein
MWERPGCIIEGTDTWLTYPSVSIRMICNMGWWEGEGGSYFNIEAYVYVIHMYIKANRYF